MYTVQRRSDNLSYGDHTLSLSNLSNVLRFHRQYESLRTSTMSSRARSPNVETNRNRMNRMKRAQTVEVCLREVRFSESHDFPDDFEVGCSPDIRRELSDSVKTTATTLTTLSM